MLHNVYNLTNPASIFFKLFFTRLGIPKEKVEQARHWVSWSFILILYSEPEGIMGGIESPPEDRLES